MLSVAQFDPYTYMLACPSQSHGFLDQTDECVGRITNRHTQLTNMTVFLRNMNDVPSVDQRLRQLLGRRQPATSYVNQPPCDNVQVAIEATGINADVDYRGPNLTIVRHDGLIWVHTANCYTTTDNTYERTKYALYETSHRLAQAGATLRNVVRTWFYVGGIVAPEGHSQRYKELNVARTLIYADVDFLADYIPDNVGPVYPASTGIGTADNEVRMSALALVTDRPDVITVPLENPRQTAAYDYDQRFGPSSPKFSRAMAIVVGNNATTYVSGTASITNSKTQHDTATDQTEETLRNIAYLMSEDNFAQHSLPGLGTNLKGLATVRAYIKRPEDYPAIRTVCEQHLPNAVVAYTIGDVCRPDLLVELEAVAHTRKPAIRMAA